MTHRLTTNYAKNYCNRTLIVKVIVENVVTFFGGTWCRTEWNILDVIEMDCLAYDSPVSCLYARCRRVHITYNDGCQLCTPQQTSWHALHMVVTWPRVSGLITAAVSRFSNITYSAESKVSE